MHKSTWADDDSGGESSVVRGDSLWSDVGSGGASAKGGVQPSAYSDWRMNKRPSQSSRQRWSKAPREWSSASAGAAPPGSASAGAAPSSAPWLPDPPGAYVTKKFQASVGSPGTRQLLSARGSDSASASGDGDGWWQLAGRGSWKGDRWSEGVRSCSGGDGSDTHSNRPGYHSDQPRGGRRSGDAGHWRRYAVHPVFQQPRARLRVAPEAVSIPARSAQTAQVITPGRVLSARLKEGR